MTLEETKRDKETLMTLRGTHPRVIFKSYYKKSVFSLKKVTEGECKGLIYYNNLSKKDECTNCAYSSRVKKGTPSSNLIDNHDKRKDCLFKLVLNVYVEKNKDEKQKSKAG